MFGKARFFFKLFSIKLLYQNSQLEVDKFLIIIPLSKLSFFSLFFLIIFSLFCFFVVYALFLMLEGAVMRLDGSIKILKNVDLILTFLALLVITHA